MPRVSRKPPANSMLVPPADRRSRSAITVRAAPPSVDMIRSASPTLTLLVPVTGGMSLTSTSVFGLLLKSVVSISNPLNCVSNGGDKNHMRDKRPRVGAWIYRRFSASCFGSLRRIARREFVPDGDSLSLSPNMCRCLHTARLIAAPHFDHNENDNNRHEGDQYECSIKTGTEDIADELTTRHDEHCQKER